MTVNENVSTEQCFSCLGLLLTDVLTDQTTVSVTDHLHKAESFFRT